MHVKAREGFARSAMLKFLETFNVDADDIIFSGDVDEIPRPQVSKFVLCVCLC